MNNRDLNLEEKKSEKIVDVLHNFSIDRQAPPDFLDQVMSKIDELKPTRFALLVRWCRSFTGGVFSSQVAYAVILLVALIGAVPQYARWFTGSPYSGDAVSVVLAHEKVWNRNLDNCDLPEDALLAEFDTAKSNTKVRLWECPSGDILVEQDHPGSPGKREYISPYVSAGNTKSAENNRRSLILVSGVNRFINLASKTGAFFVVDEVFAADNSSKAQDAQAPKDKKVLCQKRVREGEVKRRIRTSGTTCKDETINTLTGNVIETKDAKCDCSDF